MGHGVLCEDDGRMTHARLRGFLSILRADVVQAWLAVHG